MNQCPKCGGSLLGNGYTSTVHCESADPDVVFDAECDAGPIYCDFVDEEE